MPDASHIWIAITRLYGQRPGVIAAAKRELRREKAPEKMPIGEVAGALICLVWGDRIKRERGMDFVEGGNGARYKFIPENEVWVDAQMDSSALPHITLHEVIEWLLMTEEGLDYEAAHAQANAIEKQHLGESFVDVIEVVCQSAALAQAVRFAGDLAEARRGMVGVPIARVWRRGRPGVPLPEAGASDRSSRQWSGLVGQIEANYGSVIQ